MENKSPKAVASSRESWRKPDERTGRQRSIPATYSWPIEISTTESPAVEISFTMPTSLAYHLSSVPASSMDHSLVFTQPVTVPDGTVADQSRPLIHGV